MTMEAPQMYSLLLRVAEKKLLSKQFSKNKNKPSMTQKLENPS